MEVRAFVSSRSVPQGGKDPFAEMRPVLGILMESADEDEREHEPRSTCVIFSPEASSRQAAFAIWPCFDLDSQSSLL
ncbi:hypothetical protein BDZ97DRAFT_1844772 [Flammula alnicola]|nr:hypothetical protein BDZ97DRAFT_1852013 [Flammula alnicola]KAF8957691.1 hypothetical protein BDZ97DRAFT_1844772 [Flammula alnicola]